LDVDHVVLLSRGGDPYDLENLQALCRGCHIAKTYRGVNTASHHSGSCCSEDSCPGSGCDNRRVVLSPSGGLSLLTLGPFRRGVDRASPNSDVGPLVGAGCS